MNWISRIKNYKKAGKERHFYITAYVYITALQQSTNTQQTDKFVDKM